MYFYTACFGWQGYRLLRNFSSPNFGVEWGKSAESNLFACSLLRIWFGLYQLNYFDRIHLIFIRNAPWFVLKMRNGWFLKKKISFKFYCYSDPDAKFEFQTIFWWGSNSCVIMILVANAWNINYEIREPLKDSIDFDCIKTMWKKIGICSPPISGSVQLSADREEMIVSIAAIIWRQKYHLQLRDPFYYSNVCSCTTICSSE